MAARAASVAGVSEAALVHSPPLTGSTAAERLLAFSISSAQRRLYIANAYFVPHADFVQLLVDGAWSVVSTMNFDNRSLAYNNEVALGALDSAVGAPGNRSPGRWA